MGNWTMVIHGVGAHHNGLDGDADYFLGAFLQQLETAGQTIHHASLTTGGRSEVQSTPQIYPVLALSVPGTVAALEKERT